MPTPFSHLAATQIFSILMFSQISVMTLSSDVAPISPFRRKDMQIANTLQSTFMNTTNVLFLIHNDKLPSGTFSTSSTPAIIELAVKLFSNEKTFQIFALNKFRDILPYRNQSEFNKSLHIDGNLAIQLKTRTDSKKSGRPKRSSRDQRFNFQIKWKRKVRPENVSMKQKSDVDRKFKGMSPKRISTDHESTLHTQKGNTKDASQQDDVPEKLSVEISPPKQMNLNLSASTSTVIMLRNSNSLNSIKSFPINIPSLAKFIFLYDECMDEGEDKTKRQMHDFAKGFWSKFRILFTYFIRFCPPRDSGDRTVCDGKECAGRHVVVMENNMTKTDTTRALRNHIRDNNNQILFESKNITLFHSLYIYNPFLINNVQSRDFRKMKSGSKEFQELEKINLNEDIRTIKEHLRMATGTIFNGYGQHLRVVAFTTPNTIKKSDFPFLSRQLEPELLLNPFSSLDAFVGVEVLIVQELARKMNFTIELVSVSDWNAYGWKLPNGTFVGALGDLIHQRADLCMNGFFVKDYESDQLYFTTSIQDDRICVAVRTPDLIPQSLLPFKVFAASLWLLLVVTFVIASILYTSLVCIVNENNLLKSTNLSLLRSVGRTNSSKLSKRQQIERREELKGAQQLPFKSSNQLYNRISAMVSQCFRIVAVLMNASVSHSFDSSSYERIFVVLCLLLGLNLTGSFQGSLMDIYTTPREYPSIDTLEQLDGTGMLIILEHAGLQTDIFGTEAPGSILGNLRAKIKVTGVPDDILLAQIGAGKKFSALLRLGDLDRIKFKIPYRSDGKTLIHVIPDCPKTYNLAFLANKSSELYATINHYLSLIAASGLVNKWTRDSVYMFRLHGNLKNRYLLRDSQIILTLSHLQVAFFALFCGLFISTGLFIGEVCWERMRLKRTAKENAIRNDGIYISKPIRRLYS